MAGEADYDASQIGADNYGCNTNGAAVKITQRLGFIK